MKTGYWMNRGFFHAYFEGRKLGRFADPKDAQKAIDKATKAL